MGRLTVFFYSEGVKETNRKLRLRCVKSPLVVLANDVSGDLERLLRGVSFWQLHMFFWPILNTSSGIQRISSLLFHSVYIISFSALAVTLILTIQTTN